MTDYSEAKQEYDRLDRAEKAAARELQVARPELKAELLSYGPLTPDSRPHYTLKPLIPEPPKFEAYPKTPRLRRTVIITEKIDGTNAAVGILPDGTVYAQSRNRIITPGKATDNAGFAAWVDRNHDFLQDTLGLGLHFGEWWGCGIQRGYDMDRRFFSLFNTSRWNGLVDYAEARERGLSVVPVLNIGELKDAVIDNALEHLRTQGSVAAPGYTDPEGIIVFHTQINQVFKVTLDGDGHKGASK